MRGASSTARLAVRGSIPSLNSTVGWIERLTPVAPESGETSSTRGGSVSGGPPLGICLRAQLTSASSAKEQASNASAMKRRLRARRSGPRVRLVIRLLEPRARDVRVDTRAREAAVAEQLLDRAQVGAGVGEVARERVAERVRRDAEPARDRREPGAHHALHGARRERSHRTCDGGAFRDGPCASTGLAKKQRLVARA